MVYMHTVHRTSARLNPAYVQLYMYNWGPILKRLMTDLRLISSCGLYFGLGLFDLYKMTFQGQIFYIDRQVPGSPADTVRCQKFVNYMMDVKNQ